MELHQVRYYVALCRTLNFTRAAEACNVTQPALTRAIQRLEDELGGALFQRERNLTQLTELGRLMRPLLEQTLAAAEAAKEHATRFGKSELASLRIGLPSSISARVLGPALGELTRRLPALELARRMAEQEVLVEGLLHGEVDAAFLVASAALPDRLICWPLFDEPYRIAVAPAHRLAGLDAVRLADLADEIVIERRGCPGIARLRELGTAVRRRPPPRLLPRKNRDPPCPSSPCRFPPRRPGARASRGSLPRSSACRWRRCNSSSASASPPCSGTPA